VMKPICFTCRRFFRCKKSGVYFTESMPTNGERLPKPGLAEPHNWQPYKVWVGDLWHCNSCGAEIISGVGFGPIAERHHDHFEQLRQRVRADLVNINDC
jgi:hypothetical protein